MPPDAQPRTLVAILHADVAGFSRLTEQDEDATFRDLAKCLDIFATHIPRHRGRIVNTAGDAVLATFGSAQDALNCAARIQAALAECNAALPEERQLRFRVGLNLGDVIGNRGDIFGDGVNVAARIQALAEPGGICLSGSVRDAVGRRLPFDYEFLGKQQVKNISEPVRAYHARLQPGVGVAELPAPAEPAPISAPADPAPTPARTNVARSLGAAVIVLMAAAVGLGLWQYRSADRTGAPAAGTPPAAGAGLDIARLEKQWSTGVSIAVLPFTNISGEPGKDYVAAGMTEYLITDLSRLSGLLVINRTSVLGFGSEDVNLKEVSEMLGARYVITGSVQLQQNKLRVAAQLIETATGVQLWADRFDRDVNDIFVVQDEMIKKIVSALGEHLKESNPASSGPAYPSLLAEANKQRESSKGRLNTSNPEAYDHLIRGKALYTAVTKQGNTQARQAFEQAISADPGFADAYAAIALTYIDDYRRKWVDDPKHAVDRAFEFATKATAIDNGSAVAHWVLGYAYLYGKLKPERALAEAEKAIAIYPNYADAYAIAASAYSFVGRSEDAIRINEHALKINPTAGFIYFTNLGRDNYFLGRYEKAVKSLEDAVFRNDNYLNAHLYLAATYARMGRLDDARWEAGRVLVFEPHFSLDYWAETQPYTVPARIEKLVTDLKKAGLPD
jgi:adenylate cyclase